MTNIVTVDAGVISGWPLIPRDLPNTDKVWSFSAANILEDWNEQMGKTDLLILDVRSGDSVNEIGEEVISKLKPGAVLVIQGDGSDVHFKSALNLGDHFSHSAYECDYGSPFVRKIRFTLYFGNLVDTPPEKLYGFVDGSMNYWPDFFTSHGVHISRSSDDVLDYIDQSMKGLVPLVASTGWPVVLPEEPFSFDHPMQELKGILAHSNTVPGGVKVLSVIELFSACGIDTLWIPPGQPHHFLWSNLVKTMPRQVASHLVQWSINQISSNPR